MVVSRTILAIRYLEIVALCSFSPGSHPGRGFERDVGYNRVEISGQSPVVGGSVGNTSSPEHRYDASIGEIMSAYNYARSAVGAASLSLNQTEYSMQ